MSAKNKAIETLLKNKKKFEELRADKNEAEEKETDIPAKQPSDTKPQVNIAERYEQKLSSSGSSQGEIGKKIDDFLNTLDRKYDAYLDRLTEQNYRDTDTYKEIMDDYSALGRQMAYSSSASAAAGNAGNIDSMASANAHRQMLAYKNAGEQAAKAEYSDESDRYAKGLGAYASDVGDAYSLLSESAAREDSANMSLLEAYEKYKKLQSESAIEVADVSDRSEELDRKNITNRYLSYVNMLSRIFPDYAEEIQSVFFPV